MALATSNLSVNSILTTLGVSTPKEIFRKAGDVLKTANELQEIVNPYGLQIAGSTISARLNTLLTDRKLSYFKGYDHNKSPIDITDIVNVNPEGGNYGTYVQCVFSNYSWTYYSRSDNWVTAPSPSSGVGTTLITLNVQSNPNDWARTATITLKGASQFYGQPDIYFTFGVFQEAGGAQ
jgi:hypothetical protein